MSDYAHPEVLVTTEWVAAHAKEPRYPPCRGGRRHQRVRSGTRRGSHAWNWQTELQDAIPSRPHDPQAFESLLGKAGISPETTIVLYGDNTTGSPRGRSGIEILRARQSFDYEWRP